MKPLFVLSGVLLLAIAFWSLSEKESHNDQDSNSTESALSLSGSEIAPGIGEIPVVGSFGGMDRDEELSSLDIAVQGEDGFPLDAQVRLIRRDDLLDRLLAEGRRHGSRLWGEHLVAEVLAQEGEVQIQVPKKYAKAELALLVSAAGFAPRCIPVDRLPPTVVLQSVEPIQVHVSNGENRPIANAECWLRGNLSAESAVHSWTETLSVLGVVAYAQTDNDGNATLWTCLDGPWNTLQVTPPPGLAADSFPFLEPGTLVEVLCVESFALRGNLRRAKDSVSISGGSVTASIHDTQGSRVVSTTLSNPAGTFRFEDLPTGSPTVWIRGEAEGFASSSEILLSPQPGDQKEVDLYLKQAQGAEIQVLTSWGDPIPNVDFFLRESRLGESTVHFLTDENGRVTIPPILAEDTPYQVVMRIGGFYALGSAPVFAGSEVSQVISRICQVQKVTLPENLPPSLQPIQMGWEAAQEARSGLVSWPMNETPPILPSGPGVWRIQTQTGFFQISDNLPEGDIEEVALSLQPATLSLTLPEGGAEKVSLTGLFDELIAERLSVPGGKLEIDTVAGTYQLYIETADAYKAFYHLEVPPEGCDLGAVEIGEYSWISGSVTKLDGTPLPDFSVDVMGVDGAAGWTHTTDENGFFETGGLAPGTYVLVVTGDQTYGMHAVETTAEVYLAPGQHFGPLEFHPLIEGDALVVIQETPIPDAGLCWLFGPSLNSTLSMPPSGKARFPAPQESAWVGSARVHEGYIHFGGKEISAGAQEVNLNPPTTSHSFKVVGENGEPRNDFSILIFLNGIPLPYAAFPDSEGRFKLEVDTNLPCNFQFREANGRATVVSLQDILSLSEFVLPSSIPELQIEVKDIDGSPVKHAAAMHYGVGDVYQADGFGKIRIPIPDPAHPFYILAPGFIGQWVGGTSNETIVLAEAIWGATIQIRTEDALESKAASVQISPLGLSEGSAFPEFVSAVLEDNTGRIPMVPAGRILATLLDEDGNPIAEREFTMRKDEQILVWD